MAASDRPCSSTRSERLYQASAKNGSARVAARNAASASTFRPLARSIFPRLNGGAASAGSNFFKRGGIRSASGTPPVPPAPRRGCKMRSPIRLGRADRQHKLPALIGSPLGLFDFDGVVTGAMQPQIGQVGFREPCPDLLHAANDLGQSNPIRKQSLDLPCPTQIAKS